MVRSRNLNLFALVSFDDKHFNDKSFGFIKKKASDDLQLSVSGDARDDLLTGGVNTYELVALHGSLKLPDRSVFTDDPASFSVARFNASRLQNLISNRLLLLASIKGQYAINNLDSTEQFQLGGPDRVRAFGPGEGTGDSGVVGSLELRYLPPEEWFGRISRELVFSTFYDYGSIRYRHDTDQFAAGRPADSRTASACRASAWRGVGPAAQFLAAPDPGLASQRRGEERHEKEPAHLFRRQQVVLILSVPSDPHPATRVSAA